MIQKMKISEVQFETVNDYVIAVASWYTAIGGVIFLLTIYMIEREWEQSVVASIQQKDQTQIYMTNREILDNLQKRVSFDGLYKLYDTVELQQEAILDINKKLLNRDEQMKRQELQLIQQNRMIIALQENSK